MNIFGYCRAAAQATSARMLDAQRQQISRYAAIKGWPVAEFFMETGVSGSVPFEHRPESKRLLAKLQPGDVVVTANIHHAFRAAADALDTLDQLKKINVALHVTDPGGDVTENAVQKVVYKLRIVKE